MTSVKELCNTLRPGESISIDRSEEMITIRASLEGKVVFTNNVSIELLDHSRFDLICQIILYFHCRGKAVPDGAGETRSAGEGRPVGNAGPEGGTGCR